MSVRNERVKNSIADAIDNIHDLWLGMTDIEDPIIDADEESWKRQCGRAVRELGDRIYDLIDEIDRRLVEGEFER